MSHAGAEGKRLRSTILLLMASSLSASPLHHIFLTVDESPPATHPEEQRRRQQRLAGVVYRKQLCQWRWGFFPSRIPSPTALLAGPFG